MTAQAHPGAAAFAAAQALLERGRPEHAAGAFLDAAEAFGGAGADAANCHVARAQSLLAAGEAAAAADAIDDALHVLDALADARELAVLRVHTCLVHARILGALGQLGSADDRLAAAVGAARRWLGQDHPLLLNALVARGVNAKALGALDRAAACYAEVRAAGDRGLLNGEEEAALLHNLGGLAHARGDAASGLPSAMAALELRLIARPVDPRLVAIERSAVAPLLLDLGRLDEAEAMLGEAARAFERLGETFELAVVLHNQGVLLLRRGRTLEAIETLQRAVAAKAGTCGAGHPDVALTRAVRRTAMEALGGDVDEFRGGP